MANIKHVAHTLLLRAHSPEVASAIFTEKVLHKPLYLRPSSPDPTSQDARARRRLHRLRKKEKHQRGQRPRPLSAKEKRISGIYDVPNDAQKFDLYVPLHRMWVRYMWEILGVREGEKTHLTAQNAGSKLASADYHGAELTVVRSRCTGLVGLTGIVLRDTKFTFQIITKKNELKTIPKKYTMFQFEIPQQFAKDTHIAAQMESNPRQAMNDLQKFRFELHGSQFENRATDRATKKFKQRNLLDL